MSPSKHRFPIVTALASLAALAVWSFAGPLDPPAGAVSPTYRTLDQLKPTWDRVLPTAERFVIVMNGEGVLDRETGLVWEKSPDLTFVTGGDAADTAMNKTVGGRKGWRIPAVEEFMTLIDPTQTNPALPAGHPFTPGGLSQPQSIWTSTKSDQDQTHLWHVDIIEGRVTNHAGMLNLGQLWLVRGGANHEPLP